MATDIPSRRRSARSREQRSIRIIILEDHRILREDIAAALHRQADITVLAALSTPDDVPASIGTLHPDVLLMAIGTCGGERVALVRSIAAQHPTVTIVAMDVSPTQQELLDFVEAGVEGFLLPDAGIEEVLCVIRSAVRGIGSMPRTLADLLIAQIVGRAAPAQGLPGAKGTDQLTAREREIITMVADGLTSKEIAARIHLSPFTVKSHIHNILAKLGLHKRSQIARYCWTQGHSG